jgi:serine/threonine protein kinase
MATLPAERIVRLLSELQLVDDRRLQEVWSKLDHREATGDDLLQALIGNDLLTNWQVERLLNDYRHGFFYGDYKVLYLAGAGTFSRVFRAAHRETNQIVAIKVLRNRYSDDEEKVANFIREGQIGMALRHPNIIPVYEMGPSGHTYYIVMEFVEGGNLRDFLKVRKQVSPLEATRLLVDVTSAIRYAAQKGYHHRDLKLTNILINTQGVAKVGDFGLAAGKDDEDQIPRTVDYAGLEKAAGTKKNDPRSDLYFLGCIYYHMLTGQPPLLETRDRAQRIARTRFLNVAPITHITPGLPHVVTGIVQRAMEINPDRRYQTASELLVDLRHALARLEAEPSTESPRPDAAVPQAGRTVMVVESNYDMQDQFRASLRRSGYRVLVLTDPQRAVHRLTTEQHVADCVIFCCQFLGRAALDAFCAVSQHERTSQLPALLLLATDQRDWAQGLRLGSHQRVLQMPFKLRVLREALRAILPAPQAAGSGPSGPTADPPP